MKVAIWLGLLITTGCATSRAPQETTPAREVEGTRQTKTGNYACVLRPTTEGLYLKDAGTESSRRIPWESCVALRRFDNLLLVQFSRAKAPDFQDWRSRTDLLGFSFRSEDKAGVDYLAQWFELQLPKGTRPRPPREPVPQLPL